MCCSTAIILKTFIIIYIAFHSCGYGDIFMKLYSHQGVYISEYLSLQIQIMDTRIQYERVYNNNIHVNILIYQILFKHGYKNLKKSKHEMKVSFYGSWCSLDPIF